MQVNNNYSPNFGMALRIHPNAKAKLQHKSMEYLADLAMIGEECKAHKFVDLDLTESLSPVVNRKDCANAYIGTFKPIKINGNGVEVETRWAGNAVNEVKPGDRYSAYLEFANAEEAKAAYESMLGLNKQGDPLSIAFNFAKLQEKSSAYKAAVAEMKAQEQAKVNAEVEKLMKAFPGIDV